MRPFKSGLNNISVLSMDQITKTITNCAAVVVHVIFLFQFLVCMYCNVFVILLSIECTVPCFILKVYFESLFSFTCVMLNLPCVFMSLVWSYNHMPCTTISLPDVGWKLFFRIFTTNHWMIISNSLGFSACSAYPSGHKMHECCWIINFAV